MSTDCMACICPRRVTRKVIEANDRRKTLSGNNRDSFVVGNPNSYVPPNEGRGSIFGGSKRSTKTNRVSSVTGMPGDPYAKRQSIAVVECPIPNLIGRASEAQRGSMGGSKNSTTSFIQGSTRPSIAIPINKNTSVSALEVCPASPEREKLIEFYIYTSHTVAHANATGQHLQKFLQETERDAVTICVNPDEPLTDSQRCRFKTGYEYDCENSHQVERHQKTFSLVGLEDGDEYLSNAREKIEMILKSQEGQKFVLAMSSCKDSHNAMLIEDIVEINILVSSQLHDIAVITKPKGVPFVQLDARNIAHISIGFDDYGQYEIRRTDTIDYEKFLQELGLLEFMEESEEED